MKRSVFIATVGGVLALVACKGEVEQSFTQAGQLASESSSARRTQPRPVPSDATAATLLRVPLPEHVSITSLSRNLIDIALSEFDAHRIWARIAGPDVPLPEVDWTSEGLIIVGLPTGETVPQVHRTDTVLYVLLRHTDRAELTPHAFRVLNMPAR